MSENKVENASNGAEVSVACIFGEKTGMTRVYDGEGKAISVTVVSLKNDTVITQVKSAAKEGYESIQLGFKSKKAQRVNAPDKGHFQKAGAPGFYHVEELRLEKADPSAVVGAKLSADFLTPGTMIDVQGTSKGKGFQGSMKVWNFGGQPESHGHSVSHRSPGSIGNRADPGRVFPGKKMAKHLGMDTKTIQNLKVVSYDPDTKLLLVEGAIPGAKKWVVRITKAKKNAKNKAKAK